jgi:membrane-associated PAP2 superfamily phosphatase
MNRTGLFIALGVGIATALLFALVPDLDLRLAALFYHPADSSFGLKSNAIAAFSRDAAMWIAWAFAAPAIVSLAVKLILPHRRMLVGAKASTFIVLSMLLSAGILSNLIFKSHWARPRPVATVEFGGQLPFVPWWDPRGKCPRNCSFFSGEAATAFWTYAPAALAPPQYRALAYAGATVFGLATGILRMAFGGHYATDVIFAGVIVFLIVWLVHGMIFRWPRPPKDDADLDRRFGNAIQAMRGELSGKSRDKPAEGG